MNYFTEQFLTKQKYHFLNSLDRAQANIGTHLDPVWVDGEIVKAQVDEDGIIIFQVAFVELVPIQTTVCQIQILDTEGDLVSRIDKNISTAQGQGVYETLKINLFQEDVEVI